MAHVQRTVHNASVLLNSGGVNVNIESIIVYQQTRVHWDTSVHIITTHTTTAVLVPKATLVLIAVSCLWIIALPLLALTTARV